MVRASKILRLQLLLLLASKKRGESTHLLRRNQYSKSRERSDSVNSELELVTGTRTQELEWPHIALQ